MAKTLHLFACPDRRTHPSPATQRLFQRLEPVGVTISTFMVLVGEVLQPLDDKTQYIAMAKVQVINQQIQDELLRCDIWGVQGCDNLSEHLGML